MNFMTFEPSCSLSAMPSLDRFSQVVAGTVMLILASAAQAAAQTPFGEDGLLTIPFSGTPDASGLDISVADPSRILLSGSVGDWQFLNEGGQELGLLALTREGERDATFANNGEVITDFAAVVAPGGFVARHGDGHLVVAGSPGAEFGVARFDGAGVKDGGFGVAGKSIVDGTTFAGDVLIDQSDRIVVGGRAGNAATSQFAVARLLPAGDLDDTFGAEGLALTDFPTHPDWAEIEAITEDGNGRIVAAGLAQQPDAMAVARFQADGSLDNGFDGDGRLIITFDQVSTANAIAVDTDDRVLVAGCVMDVEDLGGGASQLISRGFTLVRLLEDGTFDAAFATAGRVIAPIGSLQSGCIEDIALDSQGRIVAAGWYMAGADETRFAAARFLADGSLDPSFGSDGVVTTRFPDSVRALGQAVAVDTEGRILVAGRIQMTDGTFRMAVACYREYGQLCFPVRYEYVAKLICGSQERPEDVRLARGFYATTINIHSPGKADTRFFKKLALTIPPGEQAPGKIIPIAEDRLTSDQALAVDCSDVNKRAFTGDPPAPVYEGYVVIQSSGHLDVTAVYTTATVDDRGQAANHSSIDVERIAERDLGTDLRIEKTATVFPFPFGDQLNLFAVLYRIDVTNAGPEDAPSLHVSDQLVLEAVNAVGLLAVLETPIDLPPGGSMTNLTGTGTASSFDLQLGNVDAGNVVSARFWALVAAYETGGQASVVLRNEATVDSQAPEAAPATNIVVVETQLIP